jgi:hypothetical protein
MNRKIIPFEIIDIILKFLSIEKCYLISIEFRRIYIRDECISLIPNASIDNASIYGKLELLKWWKIYLFDPYVSNDDKIEKNLPSNAVSQKNYNIKALKYAWTKKAIDYGSGNGLVAVLQWWKESGLECKYSNNSMDFASMYGHIAVLQWWVEFQRNSDSFDLRSNSERKWIRM